MSYKFDSIYGRLGTGRGSSIQAYYKFDGDLNDSSGNGVNLSVDSGTVRYCKIGNLDALSCKGAILSSTTSSGLNIDGAMTYHALVSPDIVTSSTSPDIVFFVGNTGSQIVSYLAFKSYCPRIGTHSGGFNENILTSFSPVTGQAILVSLTRDASDNIQWYINGKARGASASVPCAAAASDPRVYINDSGNEYTGALAELQILDVELTADEVLEDARKIMPWV